MYEPKQKSIMLEKELCKNSSLMENTIKIEDAKNSEGPGVDYGDQIFTLH